MRQNTNLKQNVYEDKVMITCFNLESSGAFTMYIESCVFLFSNLLLLSQYALF